MMHNSKNAQSFNKEALKNEYLEQALCVRGKKKYLEKVPELS
jgi:hypothetical protein